MHPTARVVDDHVIFEGIVSYVEELVADYQSYYSEKQEAEGSMKRDGLIEKVKSTCSSPAEDSLMKNMGVDELATLDRYHHFHGHSGLCA